MKKSYSDLLLGVVLFFAILLFLNYLYCSGIKTIYQGGVFTNFANNITKYAVENGIMLKLMYVVTLFLSRLLIVRVKENKVISVAGKINIGLTFFITTVFFVFLNVQGVIYLVTFPLLFIGVTVSSYVFADFFRTRQEIKDDFGIKNEKQIEENLNSFNYLLKTGEYINVRNPQQGVLLCGGAGSGKTYSLIEPTIEQGVAKGYTFFMYDYKFPELTEYMHKCLIEKNVTNRSFFVVNFKDVRRSHLINPIAPEYIDTSLHANEAANVIMKNLNKEWIKKVDFWGSSAIGIVRAVIWFLRRNEPDKCTLPHLVSLCMMPFRSLTALLQTDEQCKEQLEFLSSAQQEGAESQVAGMQSSVQRPLQDLLDPQLFWILQGNSKGLTLDVNSTENPCILAMGANPEIGESVSPVISLIASVSMRRMNVKNRFKSIFLLEEAPTIFIPNLKNLPNTGRSNGICTFFCCQSIAQIEEMYTKDEATALIGSLGNMFYGMVNDAKTAEEVSKIFGKREKVMESINTGQNVSSNDTSANKGINRSLQEKDLLRVSDVMTLKMGEFVGKVTNSGTPLFRGQIVANKTPGYYPIKSFVEFPYITYSKEDEKKYYEMEYRLSKMMDKGNIIGDEELYHSLNKEFKILDRKKRNDEFIVLQRNFDKVRNEAKEIMEKYTGMEI